VSITRSLRDPDTIFPVSESPFFNTTLSAAALLGAKKMLAKNRTKMPEFVRVMVMAQVYVAIASSVTRLDGERPGTTRRRRSGRESAVRGDA